MLEQPEIVFVEAQETAVIRLTIPRNEMRIVFGPAVGEVMAALAAQGIPPAGAVFAHHLTMSPDTFNFELGVPVSARAKAVGRVTPSALPAVEVARAVYVGPYEGLPAAWGEFDAWMVANGHERVGSLWEVYRVSPQSGLDPSHWRTDLYRPLATR